MYTYWEQEAKMDTGFTIEIPNSTHEGGDRFGLNEYMNTLRMRKN